MIARQRGEHDTAGPSRPTLRNQRDAARRTVEDLLAQTPAAATDAPRPGEEPQPAAGTRPGRPVRRVALLALIGVAFAGAELIHSHAGGGTRAPSPTPRQWLHAYSVDSTSNPGIVCQQLFSPAFAAVYKKDTGTSCQQYFKHSRVTPLRLKHILQDGSTAVIELRAGAVTDWTIILSEQHEQWRAVDFIAGRPAR